MKKIYLFLLIMLGVVACERTPDDNKNVNTVENIYFCNELANKVNLKLFKGNDVYQYEINPNDTIYFTTINSGYSDYSESRSVHFPPKTDRINYFNSFDSATITYNSQFYTFTNKDSIYSSKNNSSVLWILFAYPIYINYINDNSYYIYNGEFFEFLDREIGNLPVFD